MKKAIFLFLSLALISALLACCSNGTGGIDYLALVNKEYPLPSLPVKAMRAV